MKTLVILAALVVACSATAFIQAPVYTSGYHYPLSYPLAYQHTKVLVQKPLTVKYVVPSVQQPVVSAVHQPLQLHVSPYFQGYGYGSYYPYVLTPAVVSETKPVEEAKPDKE